MIRPAPDFVIVGAPKCGSTAIYNTLRRNPDIFLPHIKEPHYFAFDYAHSRAVESPDDYDCLFAEAGESQLRGEASVLYLSSADAIPAILRRRPDVRLIAAIRNPIDLFVSWHNQCLITLDEDEPDPERAWRIQGLRAAGERLPKLCHQPLALRYRHTCTIGAQIERLFNLVPESQRLVVVLDDLEQNPRAEYKRIVEFLGVEDDGMTDFLRENSFARPRRRMIARLARAAQAHPQFKKIRVWLKPRLNKRGIFWVEQLFRSNLVPVSKPALSEAFRQEIMADFLPDSMLLEKLLDRDLSAWRGPSSIESITTPAADASESQRCSRKIR